MITSQFKKKKTILYINQNAGSFYYTFHRLDPKILNYVKLYHFIGKGNYDFSI